MAWEVGAQWAARMLWAAGTAACLLASDLPVGVEALRRVAHYGRRQTRATNARHALQTFHTRYTRATHMLPGKLRVEVSSLPPAGPAPRLQARLAQMSLPPRAVWTAYYVGGAAINLGCLAWEVRASLSLV
jgi:hypothetical protein